MRHAPLLSCAVGVARRCSAGSNTPPRGVTGCAWVDTVPVPPVSEHKHPFPPMGCPYLGSGYNTPLSIIPEVGKVPEYTSECSQKRFP